MSAPPVNYINFVKPLYEPGDVVLSTTPYAYIIWSSVRGRYCDHCSEPLPGAAPSVCGSLERCHLCETDCYCSSTCSEAAFASFHQFECPLLDSWRRRKESVSSLPDMTRLLFRVLVRRHFDRQPEAAVAKGLNKVHFSHADDPGWKRTFDDLLSHEEEIKARPETYGTVVNALYEFCGSEAPSAFSLPPRDEVIATFGRIRTNWMDLCDQEMRYVGAALHLSPSFMNHSCTQNSIFVTNGLRQEWRVTRPIDTSAGDQMFLDYVVSNDLLTMAERKPYFRNTYYFDCACPFCDDSESALRRDRRLTSMCCVHGDDCRKMANCDYCWAGNIDATVDGRADAEDEARQTIDAIRNEETRSNHSAAAEQAALYLDGKQRLGVCNILVIRVREALVRACLELSQSPLQCDLSGQEASANESWLQRGASEGLVLLDVYRLLYYSPAWRVGKLCYDVGRLLLRGGRREEAAPLFAEALEILSITHGRSHGFVRETKRYLAECPEVSEKGQATANSPLAN